MLAIAMPDKPARYELQWGDTRSTIQWFDDLNAAHTKGQALMQASEFKRGYRIQDHLGEDGIFERDTADYVKHGGVVIPNNEAKRYVSSGEREP